MSSKKDKNADTKEDLSKKYTKVEANRQLIEKGREETEQSVDAARYEVANLKKNVESASATLNKAYRLLDLAAWVVPVATIAIYYGIYFYVGLSINELLGGLVVALPIALILRLIIWTVRFQLGQTKLSGSKNTKSSVLGFLGSPLKLTVEGTKLDNAVLMVSTFAGRLTTAARSYLPGVDEYYQGKERIQRQQSFVRTVRNSLMEYGFKLGESAEQSLDNFWSPSDNEADWLEKSSTDLSRFCGKPSTILKLVYADYVNDDSIRKNEWNSIRKDPEVFNQFVEVVLDSDRVATEYLQKGLQSYGGIEELVAKVDPFSLSSFISIYNSHYYAYAAEKDSLIDAIHAYNIHVGSSIEDGIRKLVPDSFDKEGRLNYLFVSAEDLIGLPSTILSLIFYDRLGLAEKRREAWTRIKNIENSREETALKSERPATENKETTNTLSRLILLLIDKRLFELPSAYRGSTEPAIQFISTALQSMEDFTLSQAQSLVLHSFATLDSEKESFLRTLSASNIWIGEGDRKEFSNLLPNNDTRNRLVEWLTKRARVPDYILLLFFYDFNALVRLRDDHFNDMKRGNRSELAALSKELLSRKIISVIELNGNQREEDISHLTSYLGEVARYDRSEIGSTFSRYSRLFEYSKSILRFLIDQHICGDNAKVSFQRLLKQFENPGGDFLTLLQITAQKQIEEFFQSSFDKAEWLEPITLAALTVFLVESEDLFLRDAVCRRVAGVERSVRVLYEYSWMNDDEQSKTPTDRTRLNEIIRRAIEGTGRSNTYLSEFNRALASGFLYKRISEIPLTKLRHIDEQVTKVVDQMDFHNKLEGHLRALNTVLQSQMNTGIIMESLRMQLVGAYVITVPTGADVIRGVVDDILPETCRELGQEDQSYADIFLKAEAGEPSVGRYTRIGVVPFRMEFSDFANKLENAYRISVNKYEQLGQTRHPINEYVANVIRIFPTGAYFRQLEPIEKSDSKTANDFLAELIRPLMIKKFGNIKTLEILASLQTPEDKVAMMNVLVNLYDTSSALYLIAQNELDGVLSTPTLTEHVKLGKLDVALTAAFEKRRLSELAITIYRSAKTGPESENSVKQNLTSRISQICHSIRARPADGEVVGVSLVVFRALYDVGMILDTLS